MLRWLKYYLVLLQCPQRPWPDRQWGLCIFDDIVEHCSPSSFKYAEYFLRPMLQSICDNSPEVRQAAAYGVGVMAQFGGDNYRPFCTGMSSPGKTSQMCDPACAAPCHSHTHAVPREKYAHLWLHAFITQANVSEYFCDPVTFIRYVKVSFLSQG